MAWSNPSTLRSKLPAQLASEDLNEWEQYHIPAHAIEFVAVLSTTGASGQVWRARYKNREVAVKCISLSATEGPALEALKRETAVLLHIAKDCRHACKFYGVTVKDNSFCIVMKLYQSNLSKEIMQSSGGKLSVRRSLQHGIVIAKAVAELHMMGVIICDLKPDNVLLDDLGDPVLTDFGLSRVVNSSQRGFVPSSMQGTPNYMSPEQFDPNAVNAPEDAVVTEKADVWAFACTMIHMLTGAAPWNNDNIYQICCQVIMSKNSPAIPQHIPKDLHSLLARCLQLNPKLRPSARDLLEALTECLDSLVVASSVSQRGPHLLDVTSSRQVQLPGQSADNCHLLGHQAMHHPKDGCHVMHTATNQLSSHQAPPMLFHHCQHHHCNHRSSGSQHLGMQPCLQDSRMLSSQQGLPARFLPSREHAEEVPNMEDTSTDLTATQLVYLPPPSLHVSAMWQQASNHTPWPTAAHQVPEDMQRDVTPDSSQRMAGNWHGGQQYSYSDNCASPAAHAACQYVVVQAAGRRLPCSPGQHSHSLAGSDTPPTDTQTLYVSSTASVQAGSHGKLAQFVDTGHLGEPMDGQFAHGRRTRNASSAGWNGTITAQQHAHQQPVQRMHGLGIPPFSAQQAGMCATGRSSPDSTQLTIPPAPTYTHPEQTSSRNMDHSGHAGRVMPAHVAPRRQHSNNWPCFVPDRQNTPPTTAAAAATGLAAANVSLGSSFCSSHTAFRDVTPTPAPEHQMPSGFTPPQTRGLAPVVGLAAAGSSAMHAGVCNMVSTTTEQQNALRQRQLMHAHTAPHPAAHPPAHPAAGDSSTQVAAGDMDAVELSGHGWQPNLEHRRLSHTGSLLVSSSMEQQARPGQHGDTVGQAFIANGPQMPGCAPAAAPAASAAFAPLSTARQQLPCPGMGGLASALQQSAPHVRLPSALLPCSPRSMQPALQHSSPSHAPPPHADTRAHPPAYHTPVLQEYGGLQQHTHGAFTVPDPRVMPVFEPLQPVQLAVCSADSLSMEFHRPMARPLLATDMEEAAVGDPPAAGGLALPVGAGVLGHHVGSAARWAASATSTSNVTVGHASTGHASAGSFGGSVSEHEGSAPMDCHDAGTVMLLQHEAMQQETLQFGAEQYGPGHSDAAYAAARARALWSHESRGSQHGSWAQGTPSSSPPDSHACHPAWMRQQPLLMQQLSSTLPSRVDAAEHEQPPSAGHLGVALHDVPAAAGHCLGSFQPHAAPSHDDHTGLRCNSTAQHADPRDSGSLDQLPGKAHTELPSFFDNSTAGSAALAAAAAAAAAAPAAPAATQEQVLTCLWHMSRGSVDDVLRMLTMLSVLARHPANHALLMRCSTANAVISCVRQNFQVVPVVREGLKVLQLLCQNEDVEPCILPSLVDWLQYNDDEVLLRTLSALRALCCCESNKTLAPDAGAIQALVALLSHPHASIVAEAAGALKNLATADANKHLICLAGAAPPLVALLRHQSAQVVEQALWAIMNLAAVASNQAELLGLGAPQLIHSLLAREQTGSNAATAAAAALRNLGFRVA